MSLYDMKVTDIQGNEIDFSAQFRDKVLLIVNTASECGYARQFPALEALNKKHKVAGFELLLFPSNQFQQQPGTNEEIEALYRNELGQTAKIFAETAINGPNESPLYTFLKGKQGFDPESNTPEGMVAYYKRFDEDYANNADIKWNFTKFLVGKDGTVIARYEPEVTPEEIEKDILAALAK